MAQAEISNYGSEFPYTVLFGSGGGGPGGGSAGGKKKPKAKPKAKPKK